MINFRTKLTSREAATAAKVRERPDLSMIAQMAEMNSNCHKTRNMMRFL